MALGEVSAIAVAGVTATNRSIGSKPMLTNSQSSNRAVLGASSEGYAEANLITNTSGSCQ
jgi:hypothetical protein